MSAVLHVGVTQWGYSSVVEHLTADQEVSGSNPDAPCFSFTFMLQQARLKKQQPCTAAPKFLITFTAYHYLI